MTAVIEPSVATTSADRFGRSWAGRRVTVVGLGKSGVAAADLLCHLGCRVRVTEARHTPAFEPVRQQLLAAGVEQVELGGHTARVLDDAELVVVSPGVPETSLPMAAAGARRLPIMSEIDLAFHFCPSPIIAVTGTNGKSTAVTLIANMLRASGRAAIACGNIGTPFSSVVRSLTPQTTAVVEVSSFQLLSCTQFRPSIGVLLNVASNHLDRHANAEQYLAAKARLFQQQQHQDWAVLNGRDARMVALAKRLRARCAWFGDNRDNPPALRIAEETQRLLDDNAQAVLQTARVLGIADPLTWQVLRSFRGLEHRMERVATVRGVNFINDSKSTTPESLLYALQHVRGDVVVILGGRNKGLDFSLLADPLRAARVKGVVLIGEARSQLRALFNGTPTVRQADSLQEAVAAARACATPGTTVLFSPACASFDMFRDFEDRGRAFKAIVQQLR